MKTFKATDFFISALLIAGFAVGSIFFDNSILNDTLLFGYLVVGAWHVTSMIVHAINGWFTRKGSLRHLYHWIAFVAVVSLPLGSFYIMYLAAPVMAVFYTWLCYRETFIKMKRPLDLIR
jgi:hypothetical protein